MLNFDIARVHVREREAGTQNYVISKVYPAMRLSAAGQAVYVQHGRYWTPGGDAIRSKDLPDWVTAELKKCGPAALAECGIHLKVEEPVAPAN